MPGVGSGNVADWNPGQPFYERQTQPVKGKEWRGSVASQSRYNLKLFYINIQSLRRKVSELEICLGEPRIDLFCTVEH